MITKIKLIKGVGKFYDYSAKGEGLDWHKNTFLYAPNAYGKSTLVNVLRSLHQGNPNIMKARRTLDRSALPQAVIIIDGMNHVFNGTKWDKTYPAFRFFDVPFIHANILSHEIGHTHRKNWHRIIIGAPGIKLAEELAHLKTLEKSKRRQQKDLQKTFDQASFDHHSLTDFLSISATEETDVTPRIRQLEQDIKAKEFEATIRSLSVPKPLAAPTYIPTGRTDELEGSARKPKTVKVTVDHLSVLRSLAERGLDVAHSTAKLLVLEHIDKNVKNKTQAKDFIRRGLDLLQTDCPFCGQDMKNAVNLLEAYRELFDDAYRKYQFDLEQSARSFRDWNLVNILTALTSAHNENAIILKEWESFIGAETLPDASAFVQAAQGNLALLKDAIQVELEKKRKDPNAESDLTQFDTFTRNLAALNARIVEYNTAVKAFCAKADKYVAALPVSDVNLLRNRLAKDSEIEKRFQANWQTWATEYEAAAQEAQNLSTRKRTKQRELEAYSRTIFDNYQGRINELLSTLGADFRLTDLEGKIDERANESYSDFGFLVLNKKVPLTARQDDAHCLNNTLSEGDKSTLAFAFFIAALEQSPDLKRQIVILDDPLSSLDETRREATARVLLEMSPKFNQLCVLTHKKDFLGMLFDKMRENTVLQIRSDRKNGSRLEVFDVEEDRMAIHARTLRDMERYTNEDFGPTPESMHASIRIVFETVIKTKYYLALSTAIQAKKGFAQLLEPLFDDGHIRDDRKQTLFDLCKLTNGPHHGEIVEDLSKKLTRDELVPLIKDALVLLQEI